MNIAASRHAAAFSAAFLAAAGLALLAAPPAQAQAQPPAASTLVCPVMGKALLTLDQASGTREYKGALYYLCCKPCEEQFEKDPAKFAARPLPAGKVSAAFLFDPVTTKRLDMKKAAAVSYYGGVAYPFYSKENKIAFDKDPKRYASVPAKELLYCPVSDEAVKNYAEASDYSDYEGERVYFCCPGCKEPFDKDPAKYDGRMKTFRAKRDAGATAAPAAPAGSGAGH